MYEQAIAMHQIFTQGLVLISSDVSSFYLTQKRLDECCKPRSSK